MLIVRPSAEARALLAAWAQTWQRFNRVEPYFDQAGFNFVRHRFPGIAEGLAADHIIDVHIRDSCVKYGPLDGGRALDVWRHNNKVLGNAMGCEYLPCIHLGKHPFKSEVTVESVKDHAGGYLTSILQTTHASVTEIFYDDFLLAAVT
eukprot:TRINITY_DN28261_c0_g1_i1.p1 TRINITY_DN28261_c0_g1~~TRINITY_DN28261_c0_g1_i1.p1  ORF type:complete len:148 (-),score=29.32 TRINITY_DN28261_c0_g1_i1:142-585(-)